MSDVVERLRYRFQLWRRSQREDWVGPPGTHLPDLRDYIPPDSPGALTARKESVATILFRGVFRYALVVFVLREAARLLTRWAPNWRSDIGTLLVVLVCLWTIVVVFCVAVQLKVKKMYTADRTNDLTNRSS